MTCAAELWRRRAERFNERDKALNLASCILNPYLAANIIWVSLGQNIPWSWRRIHRKWRVFQHVPKPPKVKNR